MTETNMELKLEEKKGT